MKLEKDKRGKETLLNTDQFVNEFLIDLKMMKKIFSGIFLLITILFIISACNIKKEKHVGDSLNWEHFIGNQNLLFDSLSTIWHEGAFIGNGLLGAMLYKKDNFCLRLDVSRTDVYDDQEQYTVEFGKYRLPIGHFEFRTTDPIILQKIYS